MSIELATPDIADMEYMEGAQFLRTLRLIGVCGHAGAGKDTFARMLKKKFADFYIEHFAAPLKAAASHAFGIPIECFNDPEQKNVVHPFWNKTPRELVQYLGTEVFRDKVGKEFLGCDDMFWIHRMQGRLCGNLILPEEDGIYESGEGIIIPDVRFQNEYDFIAANGGIIVYIRKPGHEGNVGIANHASETSINSLNFWCPERNYSIENSGTLEDLENSMNTFAKYCALNHFKMEENTPYQKQLNDESIDTF